MAETACLHGYRIDHPGHGVAPCGRSGLLPQDRPEQEFAELLERSVSADHLNVVDTRNPLDAPVSLASNANAGDLSAKTASHKT